MLKQNYKVDDQEFLDGFDLQAALTLAVKTLHKSMDSTQMNGNKLEFPTLFGS